MKEKIENMIGKIYCEDCLETMKRMPDKSIDLIVTSPPYNKNGYRGYEIKKTGRKGDWKNSDIKYDNYDDNMDENEYLLWQTAILNECFRVLKDKGSLFYNHKVVRANNKLYHPLKIVLNSNFDLWQDITWDRSSSVDHNMGYLPPTTERIFWLKKLKPKVFKNNINKSYWGEIWKFTPKQEKEHPAPFPEDLVKTCILLTTEENDVVYDPFMGSGTTAVECVKYNRIFIGSDISEKYTILARKRAKEATGAVGLFEQGSLF